MTHLLKTIELLVTTGCTILETHARMHLSDAIRLVIVSPALSRRLNEDELMDNHDAFLISEAV